MEQKEIPEYVQRAKDIWAKRCEILKGIQDSVNEADKLAAEHSQILADISACCKD